MTDRIQTHWIGCETDHHACALARLDAARSKLHDANNAYAAALQEIQSWQMEVAGRDSDIELLRALLDEAPHEHACSFNVCPLCDSRKNTPLHDDVHMKQEYHHAFQNGKCNCWKARIPRAGG